MQYVKKKPDITAYQNAAHFLRDWFLYLKQQKDGFSLRDLSRNADVAVSYLTMMTQEKRPLTAKLLSKIGPYLRLSRTELKTLERLQALSQAENLNQRNLALSRLQKVGTYRQANPAEWEVHQYLSKWYNVAIRELVQLKNFSRDPLWIQQHLNGKASIVEIEESLALLIALGLVQEEEGTLKVTKKTLQCHENIFRISLGSFHNEMLKLAGLSIENTARDQRTILGSTLALPQEKIPELMEMVREFQKKIERWAEPLTGHDQIYQIELASFPLSKKDGDNL